MNRRLCLVTGASAGIGAAFARLYAAKGHDLVLTARRAERLEALAAELRAGHGVEALVLPADLSRSEAPAELVEAVAAAGRPVDVLVNNAGYGLPGVYARTTWDQQHALLQVLTVAPAELTHRLLPGMIARGYGRILNVASVAGLVPGMPSHTLYGPSKALVVRFSQGLHVETYGTGVHVCALCPGFTWSEFHDVNGSRPKLSRVPAWMWQSSEHVAQAGYAAVEANRAVHTPGLHNKALVAMANLLPQGWLLERAAKNADKWRDM